MSVSAEGLARALRLARDAQGLSRQKLAEASGVSHVSIYHLENARVQSPGLHTVHRLAQGLGVSPATLLRWTFPEDREPCRHSVVMCRLCGEVLGGKEGA